MAKTRSAKDTKNAAPVQDGVKQWGFRTTLDRAKKASAEYLSRRPHRSFRRTYRRDYVRSLALPGYWAFSASVLNVMLRHKRLFVGLVAFYAILGVVLVGLSSQDSYTQLSSLLDETGSEIFSIGWGSLGQAGLLLLTGISGSISPQLTDVQQVYAALILLLTWLTTVWLLRAILAGRSPRLRDGLYNSGGPIVVTGLILLVLLIQLLPATIGVIVLSSALSTELFETGFIAMVVTVVVVLLCILSVYWVVSTVIALIVSTLPGMYPWQALRTAGDIVVGRRLRLLLRILWLLGGNLLAWAIVILPIILLDRWLINVVPFMAAIPLVPIAISITSSIIVIWSASYMYMLYRKVVEDDASPA